MNYYMEENSFATRFEFGELHISGDAAYGFRPFQLLVSSVAVCSGGVLRKVLKKMRLNYQDIRISAEVERNPAEADRVEKIHLHFVIQGELPQEKVTRAMELTRKNCSMVQSVKDSIEVTETFEIIAPSAN